MSFKVDRIKYANVYGPTVGDKVRLGDTELFIQIEKDFNSGSYGEESTFGGGKNVRDGMAQSSSKTRDEDVLDFVILNVIVVDHWGIVKGDVGIKDGKIVGVGKAGNPDTMDGISENMTIGASTEVHSGAGHILTAGGIDTHVHFISPPQVEDRKSTRLNSSHVRISYAVFCLKKKKKISTQTRCTKRTRCTHESCITDTNPTHSHSSTV